MRRSALFIFITVLLFMVIGCDDDSSTNPPDSELPIYEQSGLIDEEGGIVEITDEADPMCGARITIPQGALDSSVEISITPCDNDLYFEGYVNDIFVQINPIGQEFLKEVEVSLPFVCSEENLMVYGYDFDNFIWKPKSQFSIDQAERTVLFETNDLSVFCGAEASVQFELECYNASNNTIAASVNMNLPLENIVADSPNESLYDLLYNEPGNLYPKFILTLMEKSQRGKDSEKSVKSIDWSILEFDGMYRVIAKDNETTLYSSEPIELEEVENYISGNPLLISFDPDVDGFDLDSSKEYYVDVALYYCNVPAAAISEEVIWGYTGYPGTARNEALLLDEMEIAPDADNDGIKDEFDNQFGDLPEIEITAPDDESYYFTEDSIEFSCVAIDNEDGELAGDAVIWDSSIDGNIGTGTNFTSSQLSEGTHNITASVTDSHNNTSFALITIFVSQGNLPPEIPTDPTPENNAVDVDLAVTLNWQCSDPDGDPLVYDVYFSTNPNPAFISNNQSNTDYVPQNLQENTTYYWKIVVSDGQLEHESPVWSFTTILINNAPEIPYNPNPQHEAEDVGISPTLSWLCSDPDGDDLTFTVYFGTSPNPSAIEYNHSETFYIPENLEYEMRYYWRIVANDGYEEAVGDVWYFDTGELNIPPAVPSNPYPTNSEIDIPVHADLNWDCSDDNTNDVVRYDVYFGQENPPPLLEADVIYSQYGLGNLDTLTTYYWKIIAKDDEFEVEGPLWQFTTNTIQYIDFPDPNLLDEVRWATGIMEGPITVGDVEDIYSFSAYYANIYDITGLEYFYSLTDLSLECNFITDLSPISQLTNLVSLNLNENNIEDLSPIENLTNLTELHLALNEISDINPVTHMPSLYMVDLSNNQLTDITLLESSESIWILNIADNEITDLTPIAYLPMLMELDVSNNNINNLNDIMTLTQLQKFTARENGLSDITEIDRMPNISYLDLADNSIYDISILNQLEYLYYLDLSDNDIQQLNSLSDLSNFNHWKNLFILKN